MECLSEQNQCIGLFFIFKNEIIGDRELAELVSWKDGMKIMNRSHSNWWLSHRLMYDSDKTYNEIPRGRVVFDKTVSKRALVYMCPDYVEDINIKSKIKSFFNLNNPEFLPDAHYLLIQKGN